MLTMQIESGILDTFQSWNDDGSEVKRMEETQIKELEISISVKKGFTRSNVETLETEAITGAVQNIIKELRPLEVPKVSININRPL